LNGHLDRAFWHARVRAPRDVALVTGFRERESRVTGVRERNRNTGARERELRLIKRKRITITMLQQLTFCI
jgi:hypothetical protein